jgi:hypothetical protein
MFNQAKERALKWRKWRPGDRTFKLHSGITSEPGRYVKSLGIPWRGMSYTQTGGAFGKAAQSWETRGMILTRSRGAWLAATLALVLCGPGCGRDLESAPTDVVLVVLDAAAASHFSLYGSALETTPGIDRLAADSIIWERAYAQAPKTLPSMGSVLTGRYPAQSWVDLKLQGISLAEHRGGRRDSPAAGGRGPGRAACAPRRRTRNASRRVALAPGRLGEGGVP